MSDGSIHIDTKLDNSNLKPQLNSMKKSIGDTFASMRDVMMGPVGVAKMLIGAFKQVSAAVDKMENEWAQAEQTMAILGATINATGASSWTSSKQIQDFAKELQDLTGYADDSIVAMENILLGFKNIKGDNFKEASLQILNMSKVMGMDLTSAAQAVGKALDDPISGIDSLSRQGFKFSAQQKAMLKDMVETGKIAEAQKVILDELATTYGGAAEAANATGSAVKMKLGEAIKDLNEQLGRLASEDFKEVRTAITSLVKWYTDGLARMSDEREWNAIMARWKTLSDEEKKAPANVIAYHDALKNVFDFNQKMIDQGKMSAQAIVEAVKTNSAIMRELDAIARPYGAAVKAAPEPEPTPWVDDRNAAAKEYEKSLAKINQQVKDGQKTEEDANKLRLDSMATYISSLEDIMLKYKLVDDGIGATSVALRAAISDYNALASPMADDDSQANLLANAMYGSADAFSYANDELNGLMDTISTPPDTSDWDKYFKTLEDDARDWGDVIGEVGSFLEDSFATAFETVGESIVTGKSDWDDWGNSALGALSSVLKSLGYQLLAMAAIAGFQLRWVEAAILVAASAAAFVASGIIDALQSEAEETAAVTTAMEDANDELAKNKKLFTSAAKAADAYKTVLTGVTETVSSFYEGLQDVGSDLASTIVDSLIDGFDNDDFLYALEEYIRNAVIRAAVFTDSFMAQVSQIGAKLATAIATGDTSSIAEIKDQLSSLYSNAAAAANAATEAVSGAFGSYSVGTLGLPSDGLIYAHAGEAVIPSGLMSEAMARGLTIAPTAALMAGAQNVTVNLSAALNVDGRAMAGVVFKYQDELVGAAYGA